MAKYEGADWIRRQHAPDISKFGVIVADILGQAFEGIYHISDECFHKRVQWYNDRRIVIVIGRYLSTFDDDKLTRLVLLCHAHAVRMSIEGAANGYLRLIFTPREREAKSSWDRHPTLRQAVISLQPTIYGMQREGLNYD